MTAQPITDQTQDQFGVTRWRLDPAVSSAEFQVPHFWGLVTVRGHFERLDGWLEIDESEKRISLTIDAASLHTGSGKRNPADRPPAGHRGNDDGRSTPARHDVEPTRNDQDPRHPHRPRAPATRVMMAAQPVVTAIGRPWVRSREPVWAVSSIEGSNPALSALSALAASLARAAARASRPPAPGAAACRG